MSQALDMPLDDLVQGGRGRGRGKGAGKAWGKSRGSENGGRGKGKVSASADETLDTKKLDMSLEEVIEKSKGKSKGHKDGESKGKNKGGGKGKNDWSYSGDDRSYEKGSWNSYSTYDKGGSYDKGKSKGKDKDKGKGKGKDKDKDKDRYQEKENGWNSWSPKGSKGWSKGASNWASSSGGKDRGGDSDYKPLWDEHDDRGGDDYNGRGKGKGSRKGSDWDDWEDYGDRRGSGTLGGSRAVSDRARNGDDGWQRVAQTRDPVRDDRGRIGERNTRSSKVSDARPVGSAPQKRAREPEADTRTIKSIKVTNIPRDVNQQDIKDAFEQETGTIIRCRLDRGTAWIAFTSAKDARKAVDTFDRGELNGNTIGCCLDP